MNFVSEGTSQKGFSFLSLSVFFRHGRGIADELPAGGHQAAERVWGLQLQHCQSQRNGSLRASHSIWGVGPI